MYRFITIAAILVISAGRAFALGPQACEIYTKIAVDQANEERALNCGWDKNPNDPRWDNRAEGHKRWCRSVADGGTTYAELKKRDADLAKCRVCRHYARAAMVDIQEMIALHCVPANSTNPRFQNNEQAHFSWCMGLSDPSAVSDYGQLFFSGEPLDNPLWKEQEARYEFDNECKSAHRQGQALSTPPNNDVVRAKNYSVPKERRVTTPCEPGARVVSGPCASGSSSKVIGSGLLENDPASPTRGPAATGAPAGASGGGSPTLYRGSPR